MAPLPPRVQVYLKPLAIRPMPIIMEVMALLHQMVAPIDADRLLALYQVRGALDGLAARLAATASTGKNCQSILLQQPQAK